MISELVCSAKPGIRVEGGRLRVALPRAYQGQVLGPMAQLGAALLLLRSLKRYHAELRQRAVSETEKEAVRVLGPTQGTAIDRLEAALLLLEDWKAYGRVPFSEARPVMRKPGRIDWERTRRRYPPMEDEGSLVFPHLLLRRVEARWDHPVQLLQIFTLRILTQQLYGHSDLPDILLPEAPLSLLKRWSARCYSDRQRRVIGLLSRYYEAQQAETGQQHLGGIEAPCFAMVWERMLRLALQGTRPLPYKRAYRLANGTMQAGLSLQPDFIIEEPHAIWIVDAKDYAPETLPGSADISKQLLYEHFQIGCEHRSPNDIHSLFLLPSFTSSFIGALEPHISCIGVDIERVQRAYIAGTPDLVLRQNLLRLATGHHLSQSCT